MRSICILQNVLTALHELAIPWIFRSLALQTKQFIKDQNKKSHMKAITLLTPLFLNVTFGRFLFKAMQVLLFIVALFSALPPCWFSRMPRTITCFLSQVSNNNSEKIQ